MCYAKPGPRCTPHAHADLGRAQSAWEQDPTEKSFKALQAAQRAYDATPGGLQELSEQLQSEPDQPELVLRHEAAMMLRQQQMSVLHQMNPHGFTPPRSVRRGLNDPQDEAGQRIVQHLREQADTWKQNLTEDERDAVSWYQMFGHESTTALLNEGEEGSAFQAKLQEFARLSDSGDAWADKVRRKIDLIDSALSKAPTRDEPMVLFRSFRVPGAKGSDEPTTLRDAYAQRFVPGAVLDMPAYLSTSADSDLMIWNTKGQRSRSPEQFIVFEILSDRGVSISNSKYTSSVQSLEREVLLPRGSKMRVARVLDNVTYANSRPTEYSGMGVVGQMSRAARRIKVTVVQLRDITDD